ncbi:MAG: metalloregulator ArsR/SmtB family transcription factor [Chloroflexi bacterium]|jgi:protein-tyrosine-phosphatase/DNA-binding HxlR family transcriptional regulator|nr:metalloregulator ArsR/SmtB family transcription factor [Chloroflexota bacterium]
MLSQEQIADIFKALADHNRLRLLELLINSDLTNSELKDRTGLNQNLLSHHLSVLADAGLIRAQQSRADARRRYFAIDLNTSRALHEWTHWFHPPVIHPLPALQRPRRVLFLCLYNATRSQMAEAVAHHFAPHALIAHSAGVEQLAQVPPLALQVLQENGVPTGRLTLHRYQSMLDIPFDYVITTCDRVHEHEPEIVSDFAQAVHLHWSLHDPAEIASGQAAQLEAARQLYREIVLRVSHFVLRLAQEEAHASPPES